MDARVRIMDAGDAGAVASLFREMQAHYGVACPPEESILAGLARLPAGTAILVAGDPHILGFAAVATIYPGPGLKAGLFLKELFVSAQARRQGHGAALMRAVAAYAVDHGLARVDWTADRGKPGLLAFYEALGASPQPEKLFFRLTDEALADLAKTADRS